MNATRFERPSTLDEALGLLSRAGPGARILAGGTDLLVRIKDGSERPEVLVDITGMPGMNRIEVKDDELVIGATATHQDLAENPLVASRAPALAEAAGIVGSWQIRNRGTLGGNIANASPAADTVPPLVALGAILEIAGPSGRRDVAVEDFATGPGRSVLGRDELITGVRIGLRNGRVRSGFERLGTRKALSIAKVSVALAAEVDGDGVASRVRVALGAVAPTVVRARSAEAVLEGRRPSAGLLEQAMRAIESDASPITDIRSTGEYRRAMCGVLLNRLVARCIGGAGK